MLTPSEQVYVLVDERVGWARDSFHAVSNAQAAFQELLQGRRRPRQHDLLLWRRVGQSVQFAGRGDFRGRRFASGCGTVWWMATSARSCQEDLVAGEGRDATLTAVHSSDGIRDFVFDDTGYCVWRGAGLLGRLLFQDS